MSKNSLERIKCQWMMSAHVFCGQKMKKIKHFLSILFFFLVECRFVCDVSFYSRKKKTTNIRSFDPYNRKIKTILKNDFTNDNKKKNENL